MSKVYLIDGSGYIFRAYYAVAPLSTKSGLPTNALYGFTRMLIKLLKQTDSQNIIMFFDAGKKTFRNDLYPEYKANRSECPEDLVPQMPYFRKLSEALGMKTLELEGYEADDLIGTYVESLKKEHEVVVISADKDLTQLVDDAVSIWDPMREKFYQAEQVKEKFGVSPEKMIDFLALTGDASDNIPGLAGVGPKTAVQLLESYGDVNTILVSGGDILENKNIRNRKKIATALSEHIDQLKLSKELVTIKTDCPVEVPEVLPEVQPQCELIAELIQELEFESLLKDYVVKKQVSANAQYQCVTSEKYKVFLKELKQQDVFSFDLETDSLDVLKADIVGAAFCWSDDQAYYLPISEIPIPRFLEDIGPILENENIKKVGQNLKFDINVLFRHELELRGVSFDTMLAAYLLKPDSSRFNLGVLSKEYLGLDAIEYSEVTAEVDGFQDVALEEATNYAAQDAHYAWLLSKKLKEDLDREDLFGLFQELEVPTVFVIAAMERNGIAIDLDLLKTMSNDLEVQLSSLVQDIYGLAGEEFNLNSPKQLAQILFEKLELPTKGLKKTKTGISTNAVTLEKLSTMHELPQRLLEYRELFKLKSTYVDALPNHVSEISGRVHSSFNQTVAATGRLSSSNPNLQNIPIQNELGRKIRNAFVAEKGKCLISADYSQIELRILAHLSQDENLIEAFQEDRDIHASTAREILSLSEGSELNPEERRMGKVINFGIIYGMSGFRLGRELEIPVGVASQYIKDYFEHFSGVKEFFSNIENQLESNGYVQTIMGRKRYVSGIDTAGRDKGFLLRAALNAPVQGSAADLIKLAMLRTNQRVSEFENLKLLLQVHDELLFEAPEDLAQEAAKMIHQEMESVMELLVPLKVTLGIGKNWGEIH